MNSSTASTFSKSECNGIKNTIVGQLCLIFLDEENVQVFQTVLVDSCLLFKSTIETSWLLQPFSTFVRTLIPFFKAFHKTS